MKVYARFSLWLTEPINKEEQKRYKEFVENMKAYETRSMMGFYIVPMTSSEYQYAHEMAKKFPLQEDKEGEALPGVYITESELFEIDYDKKDYEKAVAYLVNFWYLSYLYEDEGTDEYTAPCCDNPSWRGEICEIQNRPLIMPAKEFRKKQYVQLMHGYGVSEEVRELLLEHGANEKDFTEIRNKQGKLVFYQLTPQNIIKGFSEDNKIPVEDECKHCGQKRYGDKEKTKPYYISESTLKQLRVLNRTEEMSGIGLEPWYIVNKETYLLLKKNYKRIQFEPIFLKED